MIPYGLETGDIAGAVIVVVKDGKVLTSRGFGYADVKARKPVDPETTLFRPGSVSKLFTWTAVMQQVQAGKLDLDRDINAYFDFKIPPAFVGTALTVWNTWKVATGPKPRLLATIRAALVAASALFLVWLMFTLQTLTPSLTY